VSETDPDHEVRFRELFAGAYADVLRFAQRRVPSHAEDIAADTFLVAWRRLDEAPEPAGQRAWLFGIARNCLLNARRGQDRQDALAVRIAETSRTDSGPAPDDDRVAHRLALADAWRRLTAAEQETLALTAFDDLSSTEAARVLGITPTAYRLRLLRARRALRRHLPPGDPTETPAPAPMEARR
jgi:RNA polymerase sigma-70 factor (ECF subfamily)